MFKRNLCFVPQDVLIKAVKGFSQTPLRSTIAFTAITAIIQSSSAVTAVTVSMVDAGILEFRSSIGIILGTNIGTCMTAQIMSLNLYHLAIPIFAAGILSFFISKKLGYFFMGLGALFEGLHLIGIGAEPLIHSPFFYKMIKAAEKKTIACIIIGTAATALAQSSSAVMGVIIALSQRGIIDLNSAVALTLGSNLGTCATALLASIGGNDAAKKTALAHLLLNLLGIIIILPLFKPFTALSQATSDSLPRQIANAHALFNIFSSLLVLPFAYAYAEMVSFIYRLIFDFMNRIMVFCTKLIKTR
ncbi:MAG: Na/Pi cotransporter family protein [Clostridia bacterium]|nr:Na/Pi cotransporter family protein [Clostridia bacterium]